MGWNRDNFDVLGAIAGFVDKHLKGFGSERVRMAVSLLPLSLFTFLYLLQAVFGPPSMQAAFGALALCYLIAFLALASGWFWARWFATGLGWSGTMVGLAGLVLIKDPDARVIMAIYAGLHALVIGLLAGTKMAALYDLQPGWRQRFGMDEFGVVRLKKAVVRGSAALPSLILWALGPPSQGPGSLLALSAAALALLGLHGLIRLRTWALFALGGAAATVLLAPAPTAIGTLVSNIPEPLGVALSSAGTPAALALLLIAATLPFASSALRYLRAPR